MDDFLNNPGLFQSTNLFFALIGVLGIYMNIQWKRRQRIKDVFFSLDTIETIKAWNWVYTGIGIRGAWFYLLWITGGLETDRKFAASFFFEYRIFAIIVSTFCVGWGVAKFISVIEEKGVKWTVGIVGALIIASGIGAI